MSRADEREGLRPTLWRCLRCLYGYWSYSEEHDPTMDGHCRDGRWLRDAAAVEALSESAWNGYEREYWMGPVHG